MGWRLRTLWRRSSTRHFSRWRESGIRRLACENDCTVALLSIDLLILPVRRSVQTTVARSKLRLLKEYLARSRSDFERLLAGSRQVVKLQSQRCRGDLENVGGSRTGVRKTETAEADNIRLRAVKSVRRHSGATLLTNERTSPHQPMFVPSHGLCNSHKASERAHDELEREIADLRSHVVHLVISRATDSIQAQEMRHEAHVARLVIRLIAVHVHEWRQAATRRQRMRIIAKILRVKFARVLRRGTFLAWRCHINRAGEVAKNLARQAQVLDVKIVATSMRRWWGMVRMSHSR